MICGLPPALSATDSVPVRAPEAAGVKVTLMVQFPPAAKVAGLMGQALAPVLVAAKSPEAANEIGRASCRERVESASVVVSLEHESSWLAKSSLVRAKDGIRAPLVTVVQTCSLPPSALSATDSVPVRAPEAVGVKVTLIVQVPLAAKVAGLMGQALAPVLVAAKSPEAANELIVKAAVPVFVSVTVIGALVVRWGGYTNESQVRVN